MRKSAVGLLLVLTGIVAACASLGRAAFKEPIVSLRNVRVTGLGTTGGAVDVVLDVYNPNNFELNGTRLSYNVLVGDSVPMGSGTYDQRFTVDKGDTTQLTFPLQFTYAGLGAAGRQLIQTGTVDYVVKGDVTVDTPLGQFTRPYQGRGRFSTLSNR
jgi:LEA14-like dessication related protein